LKTLSAAKVYFVRIRRRAVGKITVGTASWTDPTLSGRSKKQLGPDHLQARPKCCADLTRGSRSYRFLVPCRIPLLWESDRHWTWQHIWRARKRTSTAPARHLKCAASTSC